MVKKKVLNDEKYNLRNNEKLDLLSNKFKSDQIYNNQNL